MLGLQDLMTPAYVNQAELERAALTPMPIHRVFRDNTFYLYGGMWGIDRTWRQAYNVSGSHPFNVALTRRKPLCGWHGFSRSLS